MSQELVHRPTAVGNAALVTNTPAMELENVKRLVHYIWFPYVDISLIGPEGLRLRLGKGMDYYGVGKPGEDDGQVLTQLRHRDKKSRSAESRQEYDERMAGFLLRCTPYPLWNISYMDSRFNLGQFTEAEERAGNTLGQGAELMDRQIYAGVCAADFLERYEKSHGARVLTPLIGMDGEEVETARALVKLVQPQTWPLTNLRQEKEEGTLTDEETLLFDLLDNGPAHDRIVAAKLDKTMAPKAHELRRIMLGGVRAALVTAREDWEDLLFQLGNTAKGHKGNKKKVSAYDRQVAWLLKETPPASIAAAPTGDPELKKLVTLLAEDRLGTTANQGIDPAVIQQMVAAEVERRLKEGKKKPGEGSQTS